MRRTAGLREAYEMGLRGAFQPLLTCCAAATMAMLVATNQGLAEDIYSANYMLRACKAIVTENLRDIPQFEIGRCMGMVDALDVISGRVFCPPEKSTSGQRVRVVVSYIEARPEKMHEDFRALALLALATAWPCK
jgi:hypothetical protein